MLPIDATLLDNTLYLLLDKPCLKSLYRDDWDCSNPVYYK